MSRPQRDLIVGAMALMGTVGCQGDDTWIGRISDSLCVGSGHVWDEHADEPTDRACVRMCVRRGAQYVLLVDGRPLRIANQDMTALADFAGQTVRVTGTSRDEAIHISQISPAP